MDKRKRKGISAIVIVLVISLIMGMPGLSLNVYVAEAATKTIATGITASIDGTTLTVTGTGNIPREIPDNAFASKNNFFSSSELTKVTNIIITGNIYEVGRYSFTGCTNANKLTISSKAKPMNIRLGSFYNCRKLTSVTIPNNVTHVQAGAFYPATTLNFADTRLRDGLYTTGTLRGYKISDTLEFTAIRDYAKASDMFKLINQQRTNNRVGTLTLSGDLMETAMVRAFEYAMLQSHIRPNGEKCFSINGAVMGENSASGGTSASAAMTKILSNAKNKADLLNSSYKSVGVGCAQVGGVYYWIQCFSTQSATSTSVPANKTVTTAIDLPLGTNTIYIDGVSRTHNFKIDSGNFAIPVGGTKTLTLKLGNVSFIRDNSKASWSSDSTSIAKVSSGKVTGVKMGSTTIRAGSTRTSRASVNVGVYETLRVAGNNRYGTSSAAIDKVKSLKGGGKLDSIIIAYGDNFADALSATFLAAEKKAPIVLVDKNKTNPNVLTANETTAISYVKNYLKTGGTVYLIGGTFVVSQNLENNLRKITTVKTKRLAGPDRYGTNLAVLKEGGIAGKDILVCTGKNYADSLSASSVGKPILLVGDKVSDTQLDLLRTGSPSGTYYLVGGTFAVPASIGNQLTAIGGRTERVAGANRFGTSLEVAKKFFSGKRDTVVLVYGMNYPDGLSGGPVAVLYDAPVILVGSINNKTKKYEAAGVSDAKAYAKSVGARRVVAVGGSFIIPDSTMDTVGSWVQ